MSSLDQPQPEHLDGSAIAGPLSEIFQFDITLARGHCGNCGTVGTVADTSVYVGLGTVVRCSACDHMLARIVEGRDTTWLDMSGFRILELPGVRSVYQAPGPEHI